MRKILTTISRFLGFLVFFILFFSGYDFGAPFDLVIHYPLILRSAAGAILFWFATLIVGDIILKGIIADIEKDKLEPLMGGFEQRLHDEKQKERVKVIKKTVNRVPSGSK